MAVAVLAAAIGVFRHAELLAGFPAGRPVMAVISGVFVLAVLQLVIAWLERPIRGWSPVLDTMQVVVNIPVRNEDPMVLDRALYGLSRQTRLPDHVQVVDDCSDAADYCQIRDYWQAHPALGRRLSWVRLEKNVGKKHAQAVTIRAYPDADIFVTTDSDTCLPRTALREGMRPFRHASVQSVGGIELAWNQDKNWLTFMIAARVLSFQYLTCAAQSVAGGDVLVNRGPFALYRGNLVRDVLPAYLNETFLGRPVKLGDDAALTLFARGRGKAVQQPTAFCFAMYPETLSHHFRQWTRWMRGSTIRNCWRLRYLSLASWGWWYTVLNTWAFFAGLGLLAAIGACWPSSEGFSVTTGAAGALWGMVTALRLLSIRRSDQGLVGRLALVVVTPLAALWSLLVLRPARLYGIFTCLKQGWVTRADIETSSAGSVPAVHGARR
jgi:hyaluronan synthase